MTLRLRRVLTEFVRDSAESCCDPSGDEQRQSTVPFLIEKRNEEWYKHRPTDENLEIEEDVLVVSIERDDEMLTPRGDTTVKPDDLVTVFCRGGLTRDTTEAFGERG